VKYTVQYDSNILGSAIYYNSYQFSPYGRISEFFDSFGRIKICSVTIIKAEKIYFWN
jgi:hypothetical protein